MTATDAGRHFIVTSYFIASRSGLTAGLLFFLAFAIVFGGVVYLLLTRPSMRRPEFGAWTVRTPVATTVAGSITIGLFSVLYSSAIAGFDHVVVGDGTVRAEYPLLARSVTVRVADIARVDRPYAHKGRWRAVIHMKDGHTLESAPGAATPVRLAVEAMEREVARTVSADRRD